MKVSKILEIIYKYSIGTKFPNVIYLPYKEWEWL